MSAEGLSVQVRDSIGFLPRIDIHDLEAKIHQVTFNRMLSAFPQPAFVPVSQPDGLNQDPLTSNAHRNASRKFCFGKNPKRCPRCNPYGFPLWSPLSCGCSTPCGLCLHALSAGANAPWTHAMAHRRQHLFSSRQKAVDILRGTVQEIQNASDYILDWEVNRLFRRMYGDVHGNGTDSG